VASAALTAGVQALTGHPDVDWSVVVVAALTAGLAAFVQAEEHAAAPPTP
jgi:hypothetical protein